MAISSSYYLNAPSLASATSVFTDDTLLVLAADGFYSDGVISREQVSGVLLPQQTCPSCVSYNCIEGTCTDPGDGSGTYNTLEECELACSVPEVSYNCIEGTCTDPGDGSGTYATLEECEAACSPPLDTEVYFNTLIGDTVTMGVNNYAGQTFDISIAYDMFAVCDNEGTSGSDPNSATTTLYVSKDNGVTYTSVASVTASVSGGNFPTPQSDSISEVDTYTITGVTNVSQVKIYGTTDCDTGLNGKDGSVIVTLQLTIPASTVICNDIYTKTCTASTLTCTP
jgi:hypothetical protein